MSTLIIGTLVGASSTAIIFLLFHLRSSKRLKAEIQRTKAAKDELLLIIGECKETSQFTVKQSDTINRIVIEDKGIDFDSPFK